MYREFRPPEPLRDWVVCYWTSCFPASATSRPVYPDGCADIIFNFGGPILNHNAGREIYNSHSAFVVGTMTRTILSRPLHQIELLGIRFQPGALYLLSGIPQSEWTDGMYGFPDIQPSHFAHFREEMDGKTYEQRINFLNESLLRKMRAGVLETRRTKLLRNILSGQQATKVSQVARDTGHSVRQLERIFQDYVGVSPKEYLLISRFIDVKRKLTLGSNASLLELAADYGFHDHAHLTHVFKRYAGITPSEFLQQAV